MSNAGEQQPAWWLKSWSLSSLIRLPEVLDYLLKIKVVGMSGSNGEPTLDAYEYPFDPVRTDYR
jgi:hypothetical protein